MFGKGCKGLFLPMVNKVIVISAWFASALVVGMWLLWVILYPQFFWENENHTSSGNFGDGFGPLTALFSGLSLVALVATFWIQWDQVKQQKSDQEEDRKFLLKQNFETTLFSLIRDFESVIASMHDEKASKKGHAFLKHVKKRFDQIDISISTRNRDDNFKKAISENGMESSVKTFCRMFLNIAGYIDSNVENPNQKTFYFKIFADGILDEELNILIEYKDLFDDQISLELRRVAQIFPFGEHL